MGGIFGGFLEAMNVIGGGLLYLLVGSAAWRETGRARWYRVNTGSVIVGLAFGFIGYLLFFPGGDDRMSIHDRTVLFFALFFGLPGVFFLLSVIFETIRRAVSENNK